MAPEEFNPLNEYVIKLQADEDLPFPVITGREMYNQLSLTGLNKIPVIKLLAFIRAGMEATGPDTPFTPKEISKRLLVDGSIGFFNGAFMQDIFSMTEDRITQGLRQDGIPTKPLIKNMRRVYTLKNDIWTIVDQKWTDNEWKDHKKIEPGSPIKAEDLFHWPNDLGMLYPFQMLYHRLEEIERTMRQQTGRSAMAAIVTGYVGNIDQAKAEVESDSTWKFFPGNTSVERIHATEAVTHLLANMQELLSNYKEATYDYIARDDTTQSGVSRRLLMAPMLQFVKVNRSMLTDIFKMFKVTLEFDKLQVQTVDERVTEYGLQKQMRDDGVITTVEFQEMAVDLI